MEAAAAFDTAVAGGEPSRDLARLLDLPEGPVQPSFRLSYTARRDAFGLPLIFVAFNSPETLSASLHWAHNVKEIITGTPLDPKYNVWLEFLLDDRQLVFMGFVVLARILLALFALPFILIRNRLRTDG